MKLHQGVLEPTPAEYVRSPTSCSVCDAMLKHSKEPALSTAAAKRGFIYL